MSNLLRRQRLEGERAALQALIQSSPPDDVLGRMGLQGRLEEVETELLHLAGDIPTRAQVALVFDGGPVVGSSAINATFTAKAVDAFQRTVATSLAVAAGDRVGQRGPHAADVEAALHITGLVHGSFGFILEEIDPRGDQLIDTALKQATAEVVEIITRISGEDAELAENAIDEMSDRVFSNIKDFIKVVHDYDAVLKIAEDDEFVQLGRAEVERAYERVVVAEVEDDQIQLEGQIVGIIPQARQFEFESPGQYIRGRISRAISEEYIRTLDAAPLAGKRGQATLQKRTRTIHGVSRESFTLLAFQPEEGEGTHMV